MTQFILVGLVLVALQLSLLSIIGYYIYISLKKEFNDIASLNSLEKIPAEIEKLRLSTNNIEEELTVSLNQLKISTTELRKVAQDFKDMQVELKETHGVAKSASLLITKIASKAGNKEVR